MGEIVEKYNSNFSNIDKLIIFAIILLIVVAVFTNEFEIRIICVVLCFLSVLTMFLSRSTGKKEIEHIDYSKPENTLLVESEGGANVANVIESNKFDKHNLSLDEDFVVVKPGSKDKKGNENKWQDEVFRVNNEKLGSNDLRERLDLRKNQVEQKHSSFQVFSEKKDTILGKDPKAEFNFLLTNILEIIKELIFGHTVIFYWVDLNNRSVILETWVTTSEKFNQKQKETFQYSTNLVSKIIESNKAEIVTHINPDSTIDLLGYYSDKENVNSVIGIPIFYHIDLIAVLVVDSLEEDSFGKETLVQLNKFVILIKNLIKSSTEKFEYYIDSQIFKKLDHIQSLPSIVDLNTFVLEVSHLFKELVQWDYSTLITYDGKNFIVNETNKKKNLKSYISTCQIIDVYKSLVGSVIQENKFIIISDTSELQQPRFFAHEKISKSGSLLVMPIYSFSKTYGAMLFESNKKSYYSSEDALLLDKVCKLLSSSIETVSLNNYINEKVIVDDTGILKPEVMLSQLSIELSRQADVDISGILLMFSIDKYEEYVLRYRTSDVKNILLTVIDIIKSSIPAYDIIGKIEDNIIAVYRLALNLDDGKVYAEKIRKLVAGNIITTFDTKSFSITISIGLVETYKFKNSESMVNSCKKVLKIAIDEGGNRVKIN
jgi:putative methionine-R-sulfoxide reductase with GAF domain/GGDEF domain-containing protein